MIPRFMVVAVLVGLFVGVANAQSDKDYIAASRHFSALAAETGKAGRMPRATDETVAKLINTLSDTERFLVSVQYTPQTLGTLLNICSQSNAVVMSYMLFQLKQGIKPGANAAAIATHTNAVIAKNALAFQSELTSLQPFLLRCIGRQIPLLDAFLTTLKPDQLTPVRKEGILRARSGIFSTFRGSLIMVGNDQLDESYRRAITLAMGEMAPTYASVLRPQARAQVLKQVKAVRAKAPESTQPALDTIAKAMTRADCDGLCKY